MTRAAAHYSPSELTTIVASRALNDGDICFVGIGAPSAACNLARLTHAPNLVLIYESGTLETRPDVLPLSIGDGGLARNALTTVSVPEMFSYWLQGGHVTKGFLGGAQIDRFANINTTVIGSYDRPTVRLPGGGGAPEIASLCQETLVTAAHNTRTFVEKVDFVTSFGNGGGRGDRLAAGISTAGPVMVITDLCILTPEPETRELVVTSLHEGIAPEDVREATGWAIRFDSDLQTTPSPSEEELHVLRDLQARTEAAHARRAEA